MRSGFVKLLIFVAILILVVYLQSQTGRGRI